MGSSGNLSRILMSSSIAPGQSANCSTAVSILCSDKMGRRRTGTASDKISLDIPGSSAGSIELRRGGRSAANPMASFWRLRGVLGEEIRWERCGKATSLGWQLRSSLTKGGEGGCGHLSGQSKGSRGRWVTKSGHRNSLTRSESFPDPLPIFLTTLERSSTT